MKSLCFESLLKFAVLLQLTVAEPVRDCTPETLFDELIAHATDCNKFYFCLWGEPYLFDCPDGLHFNAELKICDWPEKANCLWTSSSTSSAATDAVVGFVCPSETHFDAERGVCLNVGCDAGWCTCLDPDQCVEFMPFVGDCTKFCKCIGPWQVVELDCDPGLHFNPELNVCDWPHVANCSYWNL